LHGYEDLVALALVAVAKMSESNKA
jgi:hypothetical protein